nr:DNA methyltransferase [Ruegeria lacuscaerulensis]
MAEQPFDAEEFPFAFLEAFGNKATTIKRLRSGASNKSDIGGVLQTNHIHIKVCAEGQVSETVRELRDSPATKNARNRVKFLLATDGITLEAEDLVSDVPPIVTPFEEFPDHFGFFLPLAGISTVKQIRESAFDIKATGRLNRLYVELLKDNPGWGTSERRHDMNHFMARLIFCFFAEDTEIFEKQDQFTATIEQMSAPDSSNTHEVISTLFLAMNTKAADRDTAGLPRWASGLPYVNGGLFSESVDVPRFSKIARSYLLHIGNLDWKKINPDIFGSMIQAVADDDERGALGMHYTSVPNILKVLNPLFLDDLREKLEEAGNNSRKLLNLRNRMAKIRVFDPACGSGNFLVIAYKEMRAIEAEINDRRDETDRRSEIPLTNFRGIEINDFPAEIARLALIIAEYQCDVLYRGQREALRDFLPLDAMNWIACDNALRIDWLSMCPPTSRDVRLIGDDLFSPSKSQPEIDFQNEGGETYICGNPPYLGSKKKTKDQVEDMVAVGLGDAKLLDYVAAFIAKAADYVRAASGDFALVATSSICQGEQVCLLWPRILSDLTIKFAYRPFQWSNLASNNAGVWCTIVGIGTRGITNPVLIDGNKKKDCSSISPYLIEGLPVYVYPRKAPISDLKPMYMGSNPVDGKRLIFERQDWEKIVDLEPESARFFRRYGGTEEIIKKPNRYCLWVEDAELENAKGFSAIANAIESCRSYRETAGQDARRVAKYPHRFSRSTFRDAPALHVGSAIGNKFAFLPVILREGGFVSNHTAFTVYEPVISPTCVVQFDC